MSRTYTLLASCQDRVGIVAHVSGFLAQHNGWIIEASYHTDVESNWFFMRHVIRADSLPFDISEFRERFSVCAAEYQMEWKISDSNQPKRVVALVSKQEHCISELIYRWRTQDFNFNLVAVLSNHDDLRAYVEMHNLPFHWIPIPTPDDPIGREHAFASIEQHFRDYQADTMVLARYMQVLPAGLCQRYAGRIINIHHSFLPSFAGARPYHQAYERGVKLIGATSHFVTGELDAGPIIEQDVARVNHDMDAADMVRLGKDVEKLVLARALRYDAEDRVLIHGNKTVVFT